MYLNPISFIKIMIFSAFTPAYQNFARLQIDKLAYILI